MSELSISLTVAADGNSITVNLAGVISIENVTQLHSALIDALSASKQVVLDVGKVEAIDMTTMQIFCSACKTAAANNLAFLVKGDYPDCMKTFSSDIGAQTGIDCPHNNNVTCICFGGTK